ncbi:MAG: DUF2085 domain-containing protein [Anaerolineae bacterium]
MATQTQHWLMSRRDSLSGKLARRGGALLVILAALLAMGIYTLSDPANLAHNHVLDSADWAGYAVCHRITERSFTINGRQLPLCARCTGMYLGVTLVFVVMALSGRLRRSEFPPLRVLLILVGFIGVMGIDGINSYSHFFPDAPHLYEPKNWLRLLTGMGTGLTMGVFIFPALAQTVWKRWDGRANITNFRELGGLVAVGVSFVLLILSNQPLILYVLALASAAGLLMILAAINTTLLLIITRQDGKAERVWQTAVPLLIGLLFAIIEISAVSLLRFNLTGAMAGFPGL